MAEFEDREHFIPIRKTELLDLLENEPGPSAEEKASLRDFYRLLEATFHFEYHRELEELKTAYAPFDPDADTKTLQPLLPQERENRLDTLFKRFQWLLERANYKRLSRTEILAATEGASLWGLNLDVDFEVFDHLDVYVRGDILGKRYIRRWQRFFLLEELDVPIFQRLVIILRLREHPRLGRKVDTQTVYVKAFKEIPKMDLEMVLPGGQVCMTKFDKANIAFPTISGLAVTGWKVFTMIVTGAIGNLLYVAMLASGTIGYGVKSFFGYLNTRAKYQLSLTQSLYYQNLDNNAGVLFRLVDEAEEQECREALLGYYFLWRHAGNEGWTAKQLDDAIEVYLERASGMKVDFEIGDALDKLKRLKLVEETGADRIRAVSLTAALEALDYAWDNYFQYNSSKAAV